MVAHSEALRGHVVSCSDWALAADPQWRQLGQGEGGGLPQGHAGAQALAEAQLLVLSVFSAQPQTVARQIMRRVRRHWPHLRVVLALWNAPAVVSDPEFARRCGAAACVSSLRELQLWVDALRLPDAAGQGLAAPIPDDDEQRVRQLRDSGVLGPGLPPLYHEAAQQAANAFDVKWAQVSWVDADRVHTPGSLLVADQGDPASAGMPRGQSICSYVVHGGEPWWCTTQRATPGLPATPHCRPCGCAFTQACRSGTATVRCWAASASWTTHRARSRRQIWSCWPSWPSS